jgi:hypothetical protein
VIANAANTSTLGLESAIRWLGWFVLSEKTQPHKTENGYIKRRLLESGMRAGPVGYAG